MKRSADVGSDRQVRAKTEQLPGESRQEQQVLNGQPKPRVQESARKESLQIRQSNLRNLGVWVTTQPQIRESADDYRQLHMPIDVWKLILEPLDEISLAHAIKTCRGFYHAGRDLAWSAVDPHGPRAQQQRALCSQSLDPILEKCEEYVESVFDRAADRGALLRGRDVVISRFTTLFEATLRNLAKHHRILEVPVYPGFEQASLRALTAETRWQSVELKFLADKNQYGADSKLVGRLEENLYAQGRKATISLTIESPQPGNWPGTLPKHTALMLTGMKLIDADYEDLEGLKPLLESENSLEYLDLSGQGTPDSLLPWLKAGSHNLTQLNLHEAPANSKLLLEVLQTKKGLAVLALCNGRFGSQTLTFAQLLQAMPQLEWLSIHGMHIAPDSGAGAREALKNSALVRLDFGNFLEADFDAQDPDMDESTTHQEFLQGLSEAPGLATLGLSGVSEVHNDRSNRFVLEAFVLNPQASLVFVPPDEVELLQYVLRGENEKREQKGWNPIEVRARGE